jgi:hypothetical protein
VPSESAHKHLCSSFNPKCPCERLWCWRVFGSVGGEHCSVNTSVGRWCNTKILDRASPLPQSALVSRKKIEFLPSDKAFGAGQCGVVHRQCTGVLHFSAALKFLDLRFHTPRAANHGRAGRTSETEYAENNWTRRTSLCSSIRRVDRSPVSARTEVSDGGTMNVEAFQ